MGLPPFELMLQLLAKRIPIHFQKNIILYPSLRRDDAQNSHQSSATGMQAIPITGVARAYNI